jgi:hypothetical protein
MISLADVLDCDFKRLEEKNLEDFKRFREILLIL